MLRISKLTDYALLIVSEMAKAPSSVTSAKALAQSLHLAQPTVSKILKILAESGLVRSQRGPIGGYVLTRRSHEITLFDVITAMEGELGVTDCCSKRECAIDTFCMLRQNWRKVNDKVRGIFVEVTILDMLRPMS